MDFIVCVCLAEISCSVSWILTVLSSESAKFVEWCIKQAKSAEWPSSVDVWPILRRSGRFCVVLAVSVTSGTALAGFRLRHHSARPRLHADDARPFRDFSLSTATPRCWTTKFPRLQPNCVDTCKDSVDPSSGLCGPPKPSLTTGPYLWFDDFLVKLLRTFIKSSQVKSASSSDSFGLSSTSIKLWVIINIVTCLCFSSLREVFVRHIPSSLARFNRF